MEKKPRTNDQNEKKSVQQEMPLPELTKLCISVAEMAKYMSISKPKAVELTNMESFYPVFKVGSKNLVSVEALRRWIAEQTQGGNTL